MVKIKCFTGHRCLVLLFLVLFYELTNSHPTTMTTTTNITSKDEDSQLSSTINPSIRRTLCKKENSRPTHQTQITSVQPSTLTSRIVEGCLRSNGATCNTYVGSWSSFYLKIGGWLMLGIVLVGIACLIITHFLGMRKVRTDARRKRTLSRLTWTDAKTKSVLANWI